MFTQKDFIDFYEKETDTAGFHEQNKVNGQGVKIYYNGGNSQATEKFQKKFEIPDYKIPGRKEAAQKMIELDEKYIKTEKARGRKKLYNQYKKASKEYVQSYLNEKDETIKIYDLNLPNLYVRYLGKEAVVIQ